MTAKLMVWAGMVPGIQTECHRGENCKSDRDDKYLNTCTARNDGWKENYLLGEKYWICPECNGVKK